MPKTLTLMALAAGVVAFLFVKQVGQPVADKIDAKIDGATKPTEPKALAE